MWVCVLESSFGVVVFLVLVVLEEREWGREKGVLFMDLCLVGVFTSVSVFLGVYRVFFFESLCGVCVWVLVLRFIRVVFMRE